MKKSYNLQRKFVKAVLMTLVMLFLVAPSAIKAQVVDGSEANPIPIYNKEQLEAFANCVNTAATFYFNRTTGICTKTNPGAANGFAISSGNANIHYKLMADIDLNPGKNVAGCDGDGTDLTSWAPIGISGHTFCGQFDGNYHIISGVYINSPTKNNQGFFGMVVSNSCVKNLGIVNSYINGKENVGGLVGSLTQASVIHCFVDATIEGQSRYVGGLVGNAMASDSPCIIDTCYAAGSVSSRSDHVGGIVGGTNYTYITSCYSSAVVNYTAPNQIGGVLGYDDGTTVIVNSYYDRQMCPANTPYGVGKWTSDMVEESWQALGENFLYAYPSSNDQYYPSLKSFDQSNYAVRLSTLPVILSGEQTMGDVRENFELGGKNDGFSWTSSDNNTAEATPTAIKYIVEVKKQGWFMLTARYGMLTHTITLYSTKTPVIGTEENPFTIDNLSDLIKFRDGINSGTPFIYKHYSIPARGTDVYFRQTANITLPASSGSWNGANRISKDADKAFAGIYDGGGYEVQGLNVTSGDYAGFFGYIQYGTVKNLGVRVEAFTSGSYSGVLCGKIFGGTIENCYSCGNQITLNTYCGGLVGQAAADTTRIINCHNDCNIIGNKSHHGGIIGHSDAAKYLLISHCYNSGNISGKGVHWGGIMGYSNGTAGQKTIIEYCYNTGNITSTSTRDGLTGDYFVGGIIGRARYSQTTNISYCYNTGDITTRVMAAGICGYNASSLHHCYNTGKITVEDVGQVSVDGAYGIAYNTTVTNCLNLGDVSVPRGASAYGICHSRADDCFNAGNIYAGDPANSNGAYPIGSNANCQRNVNVGRISGYYNYGGSGSSATTDKPYNTTNFYDSQMSGDLYSANNATAKTTSQMLGTGLQDKLGDDNWVYTAGMYPRIKGLEHADASIVAASPVCLATGEKVNSVSSNFTVNGCDSNVVWTKEGELVTSISGCSSNVSNVTVAEDPVTGVTILTGTRNGISKTVQLMSTVPVPGELTVTSVAELKALRTGVNTGNPFEYKGVMVPAGAKGVTFKQTVDLDLEGENWESIGAAGMPFQGVYDGNSKTISHLTQKNMVMGGLFGYTQHAKIHHLSLADISIDSVTSNAGAFIANSLLDTLAYCYAVSGSVAGHGKSNMVEITYVGGLVGWSTYLYMDHCGNNCPVTGRIKTYVGGLVGRGVNNGSNELKNIISNCFNKGAVTGNYYVGGLCASGLRASNSYNAGDVTGGTDAYYVGGLSGVDMYVANCFNTGKVTAQQRAAGVDTYVGGLVGRLSTNNARHSIYYSYNVGIVDGSNRKYVGGIVGQTAYANNKVQENYNANAVISTGEYVGSIAGYFSSNNNKAKNYYDNIFSQVGGVNGSDVTNIAEGKTTSQMVGSSSDLSTSFTGAQWTCENGYYPRVPVIATEDASYASAAQLLLPSGELATAVSTGEDLTTGGCDDEVVWSLESGNSITFNNTACTAHVDRLGVVYVVASKNDFPYKVIKINAGVSESSPLVIKSKAELIKFRNYINAGTTFYYRADSTFHETDGGNYFAVTNQGADLYFKLDCDVDLSGEVWTPIGLSEAGKTFDGNFNGADHTITGMQLTDNGNYKGFFGYLNYGSIKNVKIQKSKLSATGSYKGFVCGFNNTGLITNCSSTSDTIQTGNTGNSWGNICGYSLGSIKECSSTNDTISSDKVTKVGGICGYSRVGSVDICRVQNLKFWSNASRCGGICGQINKNRIQDCHTLNSTFKFEGGESCGGICGLDTASNIEYCSFENSTIDASYRYIGGIVGYAYAYTDVQNPTGASQFIKKCYSTGGYIVTTSIYAGGIAGVTSTSTYTKVQACYNEIPVKGSQYVGGLVGGGGVAMDSCYNTASVTSTGGTCGGLVGYASSSSSNIWHSFNIGDVTCGANNAGGLIGYDNCSRIYMSFNSGKVVGNDYVGGLVGRNFGGILDSYNAGQVYGGSFVGGIAGQKAVNIYSGNTSRSYNIGHVQGNSITGAIYGFVQNESTVSNCFYDKQFSYSEGINGVDIAGVAEGKLTSEMLNDGLSSVLGTIYTASSTNYDTWMYSADVYPQLKFIHDKSWGLDASVVTATPIVLPNSTLTSWTIPSDDDDLEIYGGGGSDIVWSVEHGTTALEIPDGTNFEIKSAGVIQVHAATHDSIYKSVRMLIGISEESPILITSYNELVKFGTGINSGSVFYYDAATKSFWDSQDGEYSRIQIPVGGDGMFFRLENDIDMAVYEGTWTSVGSNSNPFKGNFNGNDKTIKGMVVDNTGGGNYHGLFGYSSGSIKNLKVAGASVIGSNYTGALCGYNRGTIIHCGVVGGTVTGSSAYTGGLCGYSQNGSIAECYNSSVVSGAGRVGGVIGRIEGGVTKQCFNMGKVTSSAEYCGGIAGQNSSFLSDSYNTGIIQGTTYVGGVTGKNEESQFTRVYNAGYVNATGVIFGGLSNADNSTYFPSSSACDTRMSPAAGVVNGMDPNSQSKLTEQMVGSNLQTLLGTENWTYTDSLYPQLTVFVGEDASYVSTTPLYFQGAQTVLDVTSPFIAYNKNSVRWDYVVPTDVVNLTTANAPESGRVTVENCGPVSLKVTKGTNPVALRQIDLVVQNVSAGEYNDTTCGGTYEWVYNHRYYSATGDYIEPVEIGPGCNQITTLHLVVPEPLTINMESGDVVCNGNGNGYANPNVTGCFGTYIYQWAKDGDASFSSTEASLSGLQPGTYYVTVTDATKTNCTVSGSVVINEPTALTVTNTTSDSHCYNDNDGELSFDIAGGITPYSITWTTPSAGSATQSLAGTYSMSGLPDGNYNFVVKDANNCEVSNPVVVADDETPYAITAYGIEKLYDGVEVDPYQYKLKIGDGEEELLTAGVDKNLANGDVLNVTVSQTAGLTNAGEYANNITALSIKRGTEDVTCRYNVIQNNAFVRINKRNVTITSKSAEKPWDGTELVNRDTTLSGDGFAAGEGVDITWDPDHSSQTNAGASYNQFTYTLTSATNEDNYNISPVFGLLTVTAEGTLVVTGVNITKNYDGVAIQADYIVSGLKSGHHVEVGYAVGGSSVATPTLTNVGSVTYDLAVGVYFDGTNADASDQYTTIQHNTGTLTINPLPIILTSNTRTKVYDGTELYDHSVTISGDVNGVFANNISDLSANAHNGTSYVTVIDYTPDPVPVNKISFTPGTEFNNTNFNITYNQGTLTITKKAATYTGASSTEPYTGAEQCLTTITTSGLLTGHTLEGVTYSACRTDAGTTTGTFSNDPVVMNGATNVTANYALTPVAGALTINGSDKAIVITSATMDDEYYDGTAHTKQEYTVTYGGTNIAAIEGTDGKQFKLPTNDIIAITPTNGGVTGVTDVLTTALTNDFDYEFVPSEHATNYQTPTTSKGTLNLLPREVIIRSKSWTQAYTGQEVRKDELTIAGMGFPSGQGIDPNATDWSQMDGVCVDVNSYENKFEYALNASTNSNNYSITKEFGTITITKVTVTVTADDKTRTYGAENPTLTYTITGFVNNENEADLRTAGKITGSPTLTTEVTSTTGIGSDYQINIALNDLAATNYNFYLVGGTFAITARQIHINALPVTATYDGHVHTWQESAEPHYEVPTPSELRAGDEITNVVISGSARAAGTNTGGVSATAATIMNGEVDETANYQLIFGTADITISQRPLKITVQDGTHEYDKLQHVGDAIPDPQYVIDDVKNLAETDEIEVIEFTGGGTFVSTTPYEVGINLATLHIANTELSNHLINMVENYDIEVVQGGVTITQNTTPIVITSASADLPYTGAVQKKEEYTVTENDVNVPAIEGTSGLQFKLSTNDTITITPTFAGITNVSDNSDNNNSYTYVLTHANQYAAVTSTNGTIKITPVELTVTAEDKTRPFGQENPAFDASYYGFVNSEDESVLSGEPAFACEATNISPIGDYDIVITQGTLAATNGNYTFNFVNGTLTVSSSPIVVTAIDSNWIYDGTTHRYAGFVVSVNGVEETVTPAHVGDAASTYTLANGDVMTVNFSNSVFNYDPEPEVNHIASINFTRGGADVNSDYPDVTTHDGELTITPRPITIKANSHNFTYDGTVQSDHGFTVTSTYTPALIGSDALTAVVDGEIQFPSQSPVTNEVRSHAFTYGIASNYDVSYEDGTLTMHTDGATKLAITAGSGEWTYDGEAHSNSTCTLVINDDDTHPVTISDGMYTFPNGDVMTVSVTGSQTVAGSSNNVPAVVSIMHGTENVIGRYDYADYYVNGLLKVNPIASVTVNITGRTDEVTYNGSEQSVSGYDLSCENSLFDMTTVTGPATAPAASGTDAGTYAMNIDADAFSSSNANFTTVNFNLVSDGQLKINKKTATITANDESFTYDGASHGATVTEITKEGFVNTADEASVEVSVDGSITYPSESPVAKTLTLTTGNDNYDITLVPGQLTMTYGEPTELIVTAASGTWTYDGNAHDTSAMIVKVGTADAVDVPNSNTYNLTSNGDVLTVVYNGTITHSAQSPVPNRIQSYTILNNGNDVSAQYHVTLRDGALTVNQKAVTITAASRTEANGDAFIYDGTAHSDATYTHTALVGSDVLTATVTGSVTYPGTPGTNTVSAFAITTGYPTDYSITTVDGTLEAVWPTTQTALTITPTSASKTYDGSPLTSDSYTLTYGSPAQTYNVGADGYYTFANGDRLFVDIQGSNTHVADANTNHVNGTPVVMNGTVDVTDAYTITATATGTLTINPREVTITSANGTHDYDGNAFKKEEVTKVGFIGTEGDGVECNNFASITNPGTIENTFDIVAGTLPADYTAQKMYGTLTVNEPGAVTVTITGNSNTYTYNGTERTVTGYTYTSSNPGLYTDANFHYSGDDSHKTVTAMVAGTHTMELSAADFTNDNPAFNVTFVVTPGTLTINPITTPIVITAGSDSREYNGEALTKNSFTNTEDVLLDGDVLTATIQGSRTDVGQAPNQVATYQVMHGSTDVTNCYTFGNRIDGVLTVTKRNVTLTSATDSKTYDATALTNDDITVGGSGFVTGEGATYTVTGTQTVVGSSANTFSYILNSGTVADNYNITTTNGTLTVNQMTGIKVKITGNTDSKVYNGSEQSVSGYTVAYEGNTGDLYTDADFTFNGTAVAAGTHAGDYSMGLLATQFVNNNDNFGVTFEIESDGKMTITPVTEDVTVTIVGNNITRVYDGNAYTVEGYTVTTSNALYTEDCFSCSNIARVTRTDAGTTNMELAETDFANTSSDFSGTVTFSVTDGYVTITQDPLAMTLTCPTATTRVYNGEAFAAPAAICNVAAATIQYSTDNGTTWTADIPSITHVGTQVVKVKATHTNYADATCEYTLEVTPATLTVTAATRNFTYNGAEQSLTNDDFTVSGLVTADASATYTATVTGSITFPSDGSVASTVSGLTLTGANISDYDVNYVNGILTMTYSPTTLSLTTYGGTWTYDGTAHDTLQYGVTINGTTTDHLTSEFTLPNGYDKLRVYFDNASVTNVSEGEVSNTISLYTIYNGVHEVTGNYIVNTSIGKLKINPKNVTITAADHSWVYDGEAHSDDSYEVTGLVSPNTLTATVEGTITSVGTEPNVVSNYNFTNGDLHNYTVATQNGTLEITAGPVVALAITANSNSWEYDGTAHSDNGYSLTIDGGTAIDVTGSDHTFANGDVLTVTISGSVTNYSATATPNEITNVKVMRGSEDVTSTYYSTSSRTNGELTITKRPVTVSVTGHTVTDVYDGTEKTASDYDLACEDALFNTSTVSYSGTASVSSTNVCDIPMSLVADNFSTSDENFEASFTIETDGHLTITKRAATVTATDQAFDYDGAVHNASATFTTTNVVAADESAISIEVSGSIQYPTQSPVTKHITAVNFTPAALADNYEITSVDGQLTMAFGERVALDITSLNGEWTYDGGDHQKDGMSVAVAGGTAVETDANVYDIPDHNGDRITITLGTTVKDVTSGTTNTIASYTILNNGVDVSDKYNVLLHPGNLVVNPKAASITSATHSWPYDGYAHSDDSYTTSGLVGTDALTAMVTGTITTPGSTQNTIASYSMAPGRADNYTFTLNHGTLTVTELTGDDRIALTLTPNSVTKKYDGSALSADGFDMLFNGNSYGIDANGEYTFENGDRLTVDIQGSNTHVSTNATNLNTVNSWSVSHNGVNVSANYVVTTPTGNLTITPRSITMTSADDTKVYDGTALTNDNVTVTGDGFIAGEGATYTVTGTQTAVGTSDNTFTYELTAATEADDYTVATPVYGTLEVTARPITITANDYSVMYDGEAHNYAQNTGDILTVEAAGTDRGLISGHVIADTTVTGSGTDAGTYPIEITAAVIKDATDANVTSNYDITFEPGTLTITPRTGVVVTIQEHGREVEWNGSTQSVSGYSVNINDPLYLESYITFTGNDVVSEVGDENYLRIYQMNLRSTDFSNNNSNFTDVTFNILDSALYIYPKLKAEVTAITDIYCHGGNNGTATVTVTGGKANNGKYTFAINGGTAAEFSSPHTFEGLEEDDYTVTVTDSLNYSVTVTFHVNELPALTAEIVTPSELCPNQGSYPVSVTVAGGTADYSYEWSGDATNANAASTIVNQIGANDGEQTYTVTVTVTDDHTCTATASTTFTVRPSVSKPGSITYDCANDTTIVLNYGVVDTMIILNQPTYTTHFSSPMQVELSADGLHVSNRYAVPEGRDDTTYVVTWKLTDECGADTVICTQRIKVIYPACTSAELGGVTYQAVRLGGNCWTRANLSVVPQPLSRAASPNGTYKYNNSDELFNQYGYLYTWYAACHVTENDNSAVPTVSNGHVQGICPDGWALPTAEDFIYMVEAIGGVPHMKIADDNFWVTGLEGTTPSSGFDALGAGYYKSATDSFEGLMTVARFWTATPSGSSVNGTAVQCAVCEGEDVLISPKTDGYSVRCVRVQ